MWYTSSFYIGMYEWRTRKWRGITKCNPLSIPDNPTGEMDGVGKLSSLVSDLKRDLQPEGYPYPRRIL